MSVAVQLQTGREMPLGGYENGFSYSQSQEMKSYCSLLPWKLQFLPSGRKREVGAVICRAGQ